MLPLREKSGLRLEVEVATMPADVSRLASPCATVKARVDGQETGRNQSPEATRRE